MGPGLNRFSMALTDAVRDGRISKDEYCGIYQYAFDYVLSVLEHLQNANGTIHNDIRDRNIRLQIAPGQPVIPVLLDFDAWSDASHLPVLKEGMETVGAAAVAPPEASDPAQIDGRSDVYRLAKTLADCMESQTPTPECQDFLRVATATNKEDRPTCTEARKHPFFQNRLIDDKRAQALIVQIGGQLPQESPLPSESSWGAAGSDQGDWQQEASDRSASRSRTPSVIVEPIDLSVTHDNR